MNLSDFGVAGGKRKTLIILGAGASRGASFVRDVTSVLPPLDLDFFQQVSRMNSENDAVRLIEFVRSEYGHEVGLSMEQFFSEADYTDRFHKDMNVDRGRIVRKYGKAIDDFMTVLPRLLNLTTSSSCTHHCLLAEKLHAQDCIVSFNYDCIMDSALRDSANVRWDPENQGYAFDISSGFNAWRNHSRGRHVNTSIRLLKMHGSLNWKANADGTIRLVSDMSRVTSLRKSIIPPSWFKDLASFPFADVWKTARTEIRTSRVMVVVGYSVPNTDLFSKSLFKVEAGSKEKREKLELLVLVNPDPDARKRFLDLVKGGLEPSTKILEYAKLEQLVKVLERN
jgi:hypothetical protein